MFFLKIPAHTIADFDMLKFAEHVLDTSPAIASRSQMRPVMKAVEAIAEAKDGVAEMADEAGKAFQAASEVAPTPSLTLQRLDAERNPIGEPQPVLRRAYEPFYEAVESMTAERLVPKELTPAADDVKSDAEANAVAAPSESLPVAAE